MLDWLKDHAPRLAMAVGDTVTGGAVSRIADALGVDVDDAEELRERLKADPALMRKLQQREQELALQELRVRLEDRADARSRDVALVKARGHNRRADVLAYASVILLAGMLAALLVVDIPDGATRDAVLILVGIVGAIVKDVYAFDFGGSIGEEESRRALSSLTNLHK